ncbi:MAG: hypothetical protein JXB62_23220 [Pirellulales bacterium]|nr:hypothetical protein [Pirellulales bacterium]
MLDSRPGSDSWQNELSPVLRVHQIVVAALLTGCLMFLVITLVIGSSVAEGMEQESTLITFTSLGFAVVALLVRTVVSGVIVARGRRSILRGTWRLPRGRDGQPISAEFIERTGDAGKLAVLSLQRTIVGAAVLEGAAFFTLVAYLIEQSPLALGAAALLIVGVGLHFPTQGRLVQWIADQLTLLEQERLMGVSHS